MKKVFSFLAIIFSCGFFTILFLFYCECVRNRVYLNRVIPADKTFENIAKNGRGV